MKKEYAYITRRFLGVIHEEGVPVETTFSLEELAQIISSKNLKSFFYQLQYRNDIGCYTFDEDGEVKVEFHPVDPGCTPCKLRVSKVGCPVYDAASSAEYHRKNPPLF